MVKKLVAVVGLSFIAIGLWRNVIFNLLGENSIPHIINFLFWLWVSHKIYLWGIKPKDNDLPPLTAESPPTNSPQTAEAEAQVTPEPSSSPVQAPSVDEKLIANHIIMICEGEIRKTLNKAKGKLTRADLQKVSSLYLSFAKISDDDLSYVGKRHQIEKLFLSYTQITDSGLKELIKLHHLKLLFLSGTQITDAGLRDVAKLQKLTWISLINCSKITVTGVAELKKALPSCEIIGP